MSESITPSDTKKTAKKAEDPYDELQQAFQAMRLAWGKIPKAFKASAFWTALATVTIAVLTVFYVVYARRQWSVMSGQLAEMQAARQPWVGIEDDTIQISPAPNFFWGIPPHTVENPSILINVSYSLKNFGTSPALHETDFVEAIADNPNSTIPPTQEIDTTCRFAEMRSNNPGAANPGAGGILLPTAVRQGGWNITPFLSVGQKHIERLWIFVCVAYRDPWKKMHHSKYWYLTVHRDRGSGPSFPAPGHPDWTYIPIVGVTQLGADAD